MRNLGTLKAKNKALKKQNSMKNQLNLKTAKKQNLAEIQLNLSNKNTKEQKSMKIQPNLKNENLKTAKNALKSENSAKAQNLELSSVLSKSKKATKTAKNVGNSALKAYLKSDKNAKNAKNSILQANLKHKKHAENLGENEANFLNSNPFQNANLSAFAPLLSQIVQILLNQFLAQRQNLSANLGGNLAQNLGVNLSTNFAQVHQLSPEITPFARAEEFNLLTQIDKKTNSASALSSQNNKKSKKKKNFKDNAQNLGSQSENPNANLEILNQILGANLTQNSANLHEQILANLNSQNRDFSQNFANLNENFKQNLSLNLTNHLNNFNKIFDELAKAKALINEASQTMQKLENKDLSQAELEAFLRKLNFPLLGGVALGVLASILLSEISPKE